MKMILPTNWDKAGEGNDILCKRFQRNTFRQGIRTLPYRLFIPAKAAGGGAGRGEGGDKLPLVIYLHGADAAGDDNDIQLSMHDIGTYLARDDMQSRHPCYILAPQYGEMKHWAMPEIREPLWELLLKTIDTYDEIDSSRIYIYGYSAGGVGLLKLLKEHPGFFAAAVSICGATGLADIDNLLRTPLWMVHAADDTIVKSTYRTDSLQKPANLGSADIYAYFPNAERERGVDLRYTEYPAGHMSDRFGVNPHCSWVAVSDKGSTEIWEWMFLKRLKSDIV